MIKDFLKNLQELPRKNNGELLWVAGGQAVTVVLNFAGIKLLAQMGTASYGEYTLILTLSAFASLLYFGPLVQAFLRNYYAQATHQTELMSVVYRLLLFSPVILLIIIPAALQFPGLFPASQPWTVFFLAFFFILSQKLSEFFNNALNIIRKRKQNYILQGTEKFIATAALFLLLKNGQLNPAAALAAFIVPAVVFAGIKMRSFHKHAQFRASITPVNTGAAAAIRKDIFIYATPFVIWGVTGWLQGNGEKWLLAGYLGTADLGIYAVSMNLVTAAVIIPYNILNEFAMPVIFAKFADLKNRSVTVQGLKNIRMVTLAVTGVALAAALVTAFAGKYLVILLANAQFAGAAYLLPLFCIGTGLFYIGQALCNLGMALNKPSVYMAPKIISGILAVTLNWFLIRKYGLPGTAYAGIISGGVYLLFIYLVNQKLQSQFFRTNNDR